jgi:hypothetical protein
MYIYKYFIFPNQIEYKYILSYTTITMYIRTPTGKIIYADILSTSDYTTYWWLKYTIELPKKKKICVQYKNGEKNTQV